VSPVNRTDKYCSPIDILTPIAVVAVAIMIERVFFNRDFNVDNIVGIIPVTNNRPPNPSANKTSEIVNNILLMPPLVNSSLTGSKVVVAASPLNHMDHIVAKVIPHVMMAHIVVMTIIIVNDMNAGPINNVHPMETIKQTK